MASQLKEQYGAHHALEDVKALGKLLCMCTVSDVIKQSFGPAAVHHAQSFQKERAKNIIGRACGTGYHENVTGREHCRLGISSEPPSHHRKPSGGGWPQGHLHCQKL